MARNRIFHSESFYSAEETMTGLMQPGCCAIKIDGLRPVYAAELIESFVVCEE